MNLSTKLLLIMPLIVFYPKIQRATLTKITTNQIPETMKMCAGPIPKGWFKTSDEWDPNSCGKPTSISYNIFTIERYEKKPVGAEMTICNQTLPAGWIKTGQRWDPTCCGHPTSNSNNVIIVKRIN